MIKELGLEKDFELHRFKYWTISDKCNRVLECESYLDGSRIFQDIEKSNSEWLVDKAFFWVMWALFEEQFGRYDAAAALYEKALKNKAKVFPYQWFDFFVRNIYYIAIRINSTINALYFEP